MKLRNKKTGEVFDALIREKGGGGLYSLIVCDIKAYEQSKSTLDETHFILDEYDTLAELNEEWEDCTPTKPLIEDEVKRSVFKAWAEILGRDLEKADFKYDAERNGFDCYLAESIIEFANGEGINCVDREIYTFRALCGEEEE